MIQATIGNENLCFDTSQELFSPQRIDLGTLAMLSVTEFQPDDLVLDLGCGYGVVGITAAKQIGAERVVMADVNPLAVEMATANAERNGVAGIRMYVSDGLASVPEFGFTKILSNPPYHTDFSVAKGFIEKGFNRLKLGGQMIMVTKRKDWYKNKLISTFGGVRIHEQDGYYVFIAEKKSGSYAKR
ncbi:class I SAM-dependent methyltransferase [Gorillibacterium timonense]|uniref:class I SAM-dependent methyltransferase n=1 Tax=Gorillibacterium timonense TaxID=1689269 RepID=UPI00071CC488|nr:methyltransferase [Gorillibacterium timonense]